LGGASPELAAAVTSMRRLKPEDDLETMGIKFKLITEIESAYSTAQLDYTKKPVVKDLIWFCKNGDIKGVKSTINEYNIDGIEDKSTGKFISTLHTAIRKKHYEVVKFLLDKGADINYTEKDLGWTPIHSAAFSGSLDILTLLIDRGARVNVPSGYGDYPIHLAAHQGHLDIIKKLVSAGADPDQKSGEMVMAPDYKVMREVSIKTSQEYRPIHVALAENYTEVVNYFISIGIASNEINYGRGPYVPDGGRAKEIFPVGEGVIQSQTPSLAQGAFTNSLGMKFVPVPIKGGKTNGQSVMFCIWETRYKDFKAFVDATSYDATKEYSGETMKYHWDAYEWKATTDHPVIYVNWEDANAFCQWLTKKERVAGKITASQKYRLPSDHEWSCAVGIGSEENASESQEGKNGKVSGFPWGGSWPPPKGAGNYDSSLSTDSYEYTSPVGSFSANSYGLYDMGGNVEEWCDDKYEASEPPQFPPIYDSRVIRGASWGDSKRDGLLSSRRGSMDRRYRYFNTYGFRCVLVKTPAD